VAGEGRREGASGEAALRRGEAPARARRGVLAAQARAGQPSETTEEAAQARRAVKAQGASAGMGQRCAERMLGGEVEQGRRPHGSRAECVEPRRLHGGEGGNVGRRWRVGGGALESGEEAICGVSKVERGGDDTLHPSHDSTSDEREGSEGEGSGAPSRMTARKDGERRGLKAVKAMTALSPPGSYTCERARTHRVMRAMMRHS